MDSGMPVTPDAAQKHREESVTANLALADDLCDMSLRDFRFQHPESKSLQPTVIQNASKRRQRKEGKRACKEGGE